MSFASPALLVALVALPVAAALYIREQRRRREATARILSPALAPSVAPVAPGWRRHVPAIAAGLALAALIVAAARPRTSVAVPDERASILLVTDVSGSMLARDIAPNRLTAAQRAAKRFVARVPSRVNVGVMAFNHQPQVLQAPTRDRAAVDEALDAMRPAGGTATGTAVQTALEVLRRQGRNGRTPPAAIVLLSDGASRRGVDPVAAAREAGRRHVPIYTVVLGTPNGTITVPKPHGTPGTETRRVPPDPVTLRRMAEVSHGRAFLAADAASLSSVYERLGSQLGRRTERREITAAFAGGALVLLLLGAAGSLTWFGRPL